MNFTSTIEINRIAVRDNLKFAKEIFGKDVNISSVVKANAYGHGLREFVSVVESCGINHYSVFSAPEARVVRSILKHTHTLMIMGWMSNNDLEWAINEGIEFYVFCIDRLKFCIETAKNLGKKALIHLEVETGMNRTGMPDKDLKNAADLILLNGKYVSLAGLCTHYAGAESIANYYRIQKQIKKFNSVHMALGSWGLKPGIRHSACSAAAMTYPSTRMDMVRLGILQYGYWPSKETMVTYMSKKKETSDPLKQVITWKSEVMSVKTVKAGEFISYGTTYLAQEIKKIAIIPVGYASGYSRSLSNSGRLLIHGQRVGVIGLVNMNMLIADVSSIDNVRPGDEVVIIGKQGELVISVHSFSEMSDQLNYELLTRLPAGIPRKITDS
ncbi:MAG: alanine racemase [Bacteroidota bacterium]